MHIFKRETVGDAIVITFDIQSIDAGNARHVSRQVVEAVRGGARIVMDLGALRYFDVEGFAAILSWASGGAEKAEVHFCSQSGTILALFELLRAHAVVSLYRSREEAMHAFQRPERRTVGVVALDEQDRLLSGQQIA